MLRILSNEMINNLIELEKKSNIKIFKKPNSLKHSFRLRDYNKIIDDCNKMKKKKVYDLSSNIKNDHLKTDKNIDTNKIKILCQDISTDLDILDMIIHIVLNNIENDIYIETYGD
jgi:hypothetical protein